MAAQQVAGARSKLGIPLALLFCFLSASWAAERSAAQTLRGLVRVKTMQHYAEMGYGLYLRNCNSENPEVGRIISALRENDASFYSILDALIVKYRARSLVELGEAEAKRAFEIIDDEQKKVLAMLNESTAKDEALRRFNCIKDPKALAGVPDDLRREIESLQRE